MDEIKIEYLADHRGLIPHIAELFYGEWADLYPERGPDGFLKSVGERVNRDSIPLALVAIREKEFLGTACIKQYDMETRRDLTPWLAGLYVEEGHRGNGIGSKLVAAIEGKAVELGIDHLYLYTRDAEGFYLRLGWHKIEDAIYNGRSVVIMEKGLVK